MILLSMSVHVRIFITTSCCIRLKHMAIKAMPSIRYMEHSMKLSSTPLMEFGPVPEPVVLLPGTKSPNPMVLNDMKQKYDPSKNSQSSHLENNIAPPDMYLEKKIHNWLSFDKSKSKSMNCLHGWTSRADTVCSINTRLRKIIGMTICSAEV